MNSFQEMISQRGPKDPHLMVSRNQKQNSQAANKLIGNSNTNGMQSKLPASLSNMSPVNL